MPVFEHRRVDLYGIVTSDETELPVGGSQAECFEFGSVTVPVDCVVFQSRLSFVFVNRKPVLPGHLLVTSKRKAKRLQDLTTEECADLFEAARKAQKVTEAYHQCSSSTVAVQDGPDAGQTIEHVHIHVLPRRTGDFQKNDDVYRNLEDHDKGIANTKWRSIDDMKVEAGAMRATARKLSVISE